MENKNINFSKGEKRREELQLPVLHFIAADDWMDKLGNDAFCAWLKLYTWCDRSSNRNDKENDVIPTSFKKVMERLNVGRKKFYNSIIRPLWNYGLIDIMEYNKSNSDGQKPMNIIVYEYPQNDITKKYEPLEQIRNYDTDYSSASRTFAQKGGRKKSNISSGGFHTETGGVSHGNRGGFTQKPNNVSNNYNNVSNNYNNVSKENLSISEENIEKTDLPLEIKKTLIQNIDRLIDTPSGLQEIVITCNAFLEDTTINTVNYILDTMLKNAKAPIKSFRNYFSKSLKNYYENLQQKREQGIDTDSQEIIPEWFKERKNQKNQTKNQNMDEATQQELEDLIKKHSS